jgi:hypothetical protein
MVLTVQKICCVFYSGWGDTLNSNFRPYRAVAWGGPPRLARSLGYVLQTLRVAAHMASCSKQPFSELGPYLSKREVGDAVTRLRRDAYKPSCRKQPIPELGPYLPWGEAGHAIHCVWPRRSFAKSACDPFLLVWRSIDIGSQSDNY